MKYLDVPQSGSRANITASRNRYGQYYRDRVFPDQTATTRRTTSRASMATIVAAWQATLTDDQRRAWSEWAVLWPAVDAFGRRHALSGYGAFVRTNLLVFSNVAAVVQTDPLWDVPPASVVQLTVGAWAASALTVSWAAGDPLDRLEFFQSLRPVSPGAVWLPGRGNAWFRAWGASSDLGTTALPVTGMSIGDRVGFRWREIRGDVVPGPWQTFASVRTA